MLRTMASAAAIALAAGLVASPAASAPVKLNDAQLAAVVAGTRFTITNQVSDQFVENGHPADPDLQNAWGLSQGPGTFLWVANNRTDTSTLYDDTFGKFGLTVNVPGDPTGTVFVGLPNQFNLAGDNTPTLFAFDTEGGQIEGWNFNVDLHNAIVKVDESSMGSVFKGLTLGMSSAGARLYAADFAHGYVSVYDNGFTKVGTFTDPNLPSGYSPFNVQALNGLIYVTFAQRVPDSIDEKDGQGLGFVDVFSTDGVLVRRLVQHGLLNAPWGLAIAPPSFGQFAGALLVGNFGNGEINAYDAVTGKFLGTLRNDDNSKIKIDGLWALRTGPNGTITFSSGPDDEAHGLIGSIAGDSPGFGGDEVVGMAEMMRSR